MRLVRSAAILAFFCSSMLAAPLHAQGDEEGIRVSATVAPLEVPQNRTAVVTVRLEWAGDLDRFEINRFDNPLVENLDIIATASANRVQVVGGLKVARQEYQFTVKPEALGMAYVDGIVIRYGDKETDKEYRLHTSRLELKVIDPLPEPGSKLWLIILSASLLAFAVTIFLVRRIRAGRAEAARLAQEQLASRVSLEEEFGVRLKEEIDLRRVDLDVSEALGTLSGLVRRFLAEKFNLPLLGSTTSEARLLLNQAGAEEKLVADALAILESADIAKFSGAGQQRSELERAYTLFESWLR